jgi:HK97 family phage portal protein
MGMLAKVGEILLGKPDKLTRTPATDDFLRGGDTLWSSPTVSGMQISQVTALNVSAVMACVTMLAEDYAKLTPRVIKGIVEQPNHPVAKLLVEPNDYQSGFEFFEMLVLGICLRGNAYAVKLKNFRGQITALIPINPDNVALWQAIDGSLFYLVTPGNYHERALLADQPLLIPAADMLHVRGFSLNGLQGASRIVLAREAIGLALGQEQQAARWMGNAAKPAGVLSTEQKLDDPTIARLKANWAEANVGLQNTGRTAVLEAGVTWQQIAMTAQDVEFIASRAFQIQEVARIWRVPAHMIGDLSRSTNNNIVQQSQEYVNFTLSGYTQRFRWAMVRAFGLRAEGLDIDFDMSPVLQGDITSRYNAHRIAIMSGFKTPNEVRAEEKLPPKDHGDDYVSVEQCCRRRQPVHRKPAGRQRHAGRRAGRWRAEGLPWPDRPGG